MKEVLVMVPCRPHHRARLERMDACSFRYLEEIPEAQRQQAIQEAHAIIGEPEISEIQTNQALEWIQMTWAGTDKYTRNPGFPQTVRLTTASGAFGGVIAEYVFGGILALYRHFPSYREQQKQHRWADCGRERTIEGKRVLILGTGDIGENLAKRFQAFSAQVIGIRRKASSPAPYFDAVVTLSELEEQLEQADLVIGCLPNTPDTRHLFDRARMKRMKADAVLVNVGRGNLICMDDLAQVLAEGHLLGAVLDVTEPEPLPKEHLLWEQENLILTPHIAGPSFHHAPETEDKIWEICCDNLHRWLNGEPLRNQVDWTLGYRGDSTEQTKE